MRCWKNVYADAHKLNNASELIFLVFLQLSLIFTALGQPNMGVSSTYDHRHAILTYKRTHVPLNWRDLIWPTTFKVEDSSQGGISLLSPCEEMLFYLFTYFLIHMLICISSLREHGHINTTYNAHKSCYITHSQHTYADNLAT